MENLPAGTRPVAVAYADWQAAGAPAPEEVLTAGAAAGCPYLLVDTYDKSRGNLLAHLSASDLHVLTAQARAAGVELVLAGSLDEQAIAELLPLSPAYIAVRGAVCTGNRSGQIDETKIQRLKNNPRRLAPALPQPCPSSSLKQLLELLPDRLLDLAAEEHCRERQRAKHVDGVILDDERPLDVHPAGRKAEFQPIGRPLAADVRDIARIVALDVIDELADAIPRWRRAPCCAAPKPETRPLRFLTIVETAAIAGVPEGQAAAKSIGQYIQFFARAGHRTRRLHLNRRLGRGLKIPIPLPDGIDH